MEYTLLAPQFAELKKPKPKQVEMKEKRFCRNIFMESFKDLKIYLFLCFPLYYQVTNRNAWPTDNFQLRGDRDIQKGFSTIVIVMLQSGNKASEYRVNNIATM